MIYAVDTNVLLRIFKRADPECSTIRKAFLNLRQDGHSLMISPQNMAEFWCVATRPATARGGFGLTIEQTDKQTRILEKFFHIVPEERQTYSIWRDLVKTHSVSGVRVHDARLVAWMMTHSIDDIITLNGSDFVRYPGMKAHLPSSFV
jgi:predicted nucleic acid-binding protein